MSRIETLHEGEELVRRILDAVPGGVVHVGYTGTETKIAEMVQHLVHRNIGIVGVEPERNELERIFLEVTRGDVQ